jgi:hypothetical protein
LPAGTIGDFDKQVAELESRLAQVNTHSDKMEKELLEQAEAVADLDRKFESAMLLLKQH